MSRQLDEPDLMLDRVGWDVVMGLQVYIVMNGRVTGLNRKISWQKCQSSEKIDARLRIRLRPQHSWWPPDDRIFCFALFMVSSNLILLT